ncbi:PIN domain-containing protein [Treponema sp.]|uniref:type II toxin-antitoxin system VapC family toxin n=1 Tax=Treponema sp. TaxID=166 RepID=UPI00257DE44B|nr:PIN domain-containing protein [Treponema sp.]MBE6353972.1 type II toxin-antitoxin system VapC family toxin [Treponema sp.]
MSKTYFNTTPLIYFLDDEKPFSDKVASFIFDHQNEDNFYLTSTITDTEYLIFPYRMEDSDKIQAYEKFLSDFGFQIIEPNRAITKYAAKLHSKYPGLKGMDSIHLATSIYFNCDTFLTNDTQLRQITEANVVLVDDL